MHFFINCVLNFCPPLSYAEFHFLPGLVLARGPWGLAVISSQACSCFHHIPEASDKGDKQRLPSTAISPNFLFRLTGLDTWSISYISIFKTDHDCIQEVKLHNESCEIAENLRAQVKAKA